MFLASRGRFLGGSLILKVARLVYVVPKAYAGLNQSDKYQVARLIGRINRRLAEQPDAATLLLGPGRWGTSTPSLGIPVSFAEINKFTALGEVAFETAGFVPDLSYGTHFFHDLVETGIFYLVINPQEPETVFNKDFINKQPNSLAGYIPDSQKWEEVLRIIDFREAGYDFWLYADVGSQKVLGWVNY